MGERGFLSPLISARQREEAAEGVQEHRSCSLYVDCLGKRLLCWIKGS